MVLSQPTAAIQAALRCAHQQLERAAPHKPLLTLLRRAVPAVQEEKNAAQLLDEEERPQFVPTAYDSLRRVSSAVLCALRWQGRGTECSVVAWLLTWTCTPASPLRLHTFPAQPQVPAYASFIKERFERCLDLYLCPRTRRKRLIIEGGWRRAAWAGGLVGGWESRAAGAAPRAADS